MHLLDSDTARLVLGYLKDKGLMKTFVAFLQESHDLSEYWRVLNSGKTPSTTVLGFTLQSILEEYANLSFRVTDLTARLAQFTGAEATHFNVRERPCVEQQDIQAVVDSHMKSEAAKERRNRRQKERRSRIRNRPTNSELGGTSSQVSPGSRPSSHRIEASSSQVSQVFQISASSQGQEISSQVVGNSEQGVAEPSHSNNRDGKNKSSKDNDLDLDDDDFDSLDRLLADTNLHEKLAESINKVLKRDQIVTSDQPKTPSVASKKKNISQPEKDRSSVNSEEKTSKDPSEMVDNIISMTADEPGLGQLLSLFQFQPDTVPKSTNASAVVEKQNKSATLYLPTVNSDDINLYSCPDFNTTCVPTSDPAIISQSSPENNFCDTPNVQFQSNSETTVVINNPENVANSSEVTHQPPSILNSTSVSTSLISHSTNENFQTIPNNDNNSGIVDCNKTSHNHNEEVTNLNKSSISPCESSRHSVLNLSPQRELSFPAKSSHPIPNYQKHRVKRCPKKLVQDKDHDDCKHSHTTLSDLGTGNGECLGLTNFEKDNLPQFQHEEAESSGKKSGSERRFSGHSSHLSNETIIIKKREDKDNTDKGKDSFTENLENVRSSSEQLLLPGFMPMSSSTPILTTTSNVPSTKSSSSIHSPDRHLITTVDTSTGFGSSSNCQRSLTSHNASAPPDYGMEENSLSVFSFIEKSAALMTGETYIPRHMRIQNNLKDNEEITSKPNTVITNECYEIVDSGTSAEIEIQSAQTQHPEKLGENVVTETEISTFENNTNKKGKNNITSDISTATPNTNEELKSKGSGKSEPQSTAEESQMKNNDNSTNVQAEASATPDDGSDSDSSFESKVSTPNAVYVKPLRLTNPITRNKYLVDTKLLEILGKIKEGFSGEGRSSRSEAKSSSFVENQVNSDTGDQQPKMTDVENNNARENNDVNLKNCNNEEHKIEEEIINVLNTPEKEMDSVKLTHRNTDTLDFRAEEGLLDFSATISTPFITNDVRVTDDSPRKLVENHMKNNESASMPASFPSTLRRENYNDKCHNKPNDSRSPISSSSASKFHPRSKQNFSPIMPSFSPSCRKVIAFNSAHSPFIPSHLKKKGPSRRITPMEVSFSTPSPLGMMSPSSPAAFIIDLGSPNRPNTPAVDSAPVSPCVELKKTPSNTDKSTTLDKTPLLPSSSSQRKPKRVVPTLISKSVSKVGGDSIFSSSSCSQNGSLFHQDESKIVSSTSDPASPHSEEEAFRMLKNFIFKSYSKPQPNQEITSSNSTIGRHAMRKCGCSSRDICTHVKGKGRLSLKKHSASVIKNRYKDLSISTDFKKKVDENKSKLKDVDSVSGVVEVEAEIVCDSSSKEALVNYKKDVAVTDHACESRSSIESFIAVGIMQKGSNGTKSEFEDKPMSSKQLKGNTDAQQGKSIENVHPVESIMVSNRQEEGVDIAGIKKHKAEIYQNVIADEVCNSEQKDISNKHTEIQSSEKSDSGNRNFNSDNPTDSGGKGNNSQSSSDSRAKSCENEKVVDDHDNIPLAAPYFPELSNTLDFFKLKKQNLATNEAENQENQISVIADKEKTESQTRKMTLRSANLKNISPCPGMLQKVSQSNNFKELSPLCGTSTHPESPCKYPHQGTAQSSSCLLSQAMHECGIPFESSEQSLMEASRFNELQGGKPTDYSSIGFAVQESAALNSNPTFEELQRQQSSSSRKSQNSSYAKSSSKSKTRREKGSPNTMTTTAAPQCPQPVLQISQNPPPPSPFLNFVQPTIISLQQPGALVPGSVAYFCRPNQPPVAFTISVDGNVVIIPSTFPQPPSILSLNSNSENNLPHPPPPLPPPSLTHHSSVISPPSMPNMELISQTTQSFPVQSSSNTDIVEKSIDSNNSKSISSQSHSSKVKKKKKYSEFTKAWKKKKESEVTKALLRKKKSGSGSTLSSNGKKRQSDSSSALEVKKKSTYSSLLQKVATRRKIGQLSSSPKKASVSTYFKRAKRKLPLETNEAEVHPTPKNIIECSDKTEEIVRMISNTEEIVADQSHVLNQALSGNFQKPQEANDKLSLVTVEAEVHPTPKHIEPSDKTEENVRVISNSEEMAAAVASIEDISYHSSSEREITDYFKNSKSSHSDSSRVKRKDSESTKTSKEKKSDSSSNVPSRGKKKHSDSSSASMGEKKNTDSSNNASLQKIATRRTRENIMSSPNKASDSTDFQKPEKANCELSSDKTEKNVRLMSDSEEIAAAVAGIENMYNDSFVDRITINNASENLDSMENFNYLTDDRNSYGSVKTQELITNIGDVDCDNASEIVFTGSASTDHLETDGATLRKDTELVTQSLEQSNCLKNTQNLRESLTMDDNDEVDNRQIQGLNDESLEVKDKTGFTQVKNLRRSLRKQNPTILENIDLPQQKESPRERLDKEIADVKGAVGSIRISRQSKRSNSENNSRHNNNKSTDSEENNSSFEKEIMLRRLDLKKRNKLRVSGNTKGIEESLSSPVKVIRENKSRSAFDVRVKTNSKELESSSVETESSSSGRVRLHSTAVNESFSGTSIMEEDLEKLSTKEESREGKGSSCFTPPFQSAKKSNVGKKRWQLKTFANVLKSVSLQYIDKNASTGSRSRDHLSDDRESDDESPIRSGRRTNKSNVGKERWQPKSFADVLKGVSLQNIDKNASTGSRSRDHLSDDRESDDESSVRSGNRTRNTSTNNSFSESGSSREESDVSYAKRIQDKSVSLDESYDGDIIKDVSDYSNTLIDRAVKKKVVKNYIDCVRKQKPESRIDSSVYQNYVSTSTGNKRNKVQSKEQKERELSPLMVEDDMGFEEGKEKQKNQNDLSIVKRSLNNGEEDKQVHSKEKKNVHEKESVSEPKSPIFMSSCRKESVRNVDDSRKRKASESLLEEGRKKFKKDKLEEVALPELPQFKQRNKRKEKGVLDKDRNLFKEFAAVSKKDHTSNKSSNIANVTEHGDGHVLDVIYVDADNQHPNEPTAKDNLSDSLKTTVESSITSNYDNTQKTTVERSIKSKCNNTQKTMVESSVKLKLDNTPKTTVESSIKSKRGNTSKSIIESSIKSKCDNTQKTAVESSIKSKCDNSPASAASTSVGVESTPSQRLSPEEEQVLSSQCPHTNKTSHPDNSSPDVTVSSAQKTGSAKSITKRKINKLLSKIHRAPPPPST